MRIFIAEDEHDLNRILSLRLRGEGYTVESCENGLDALNALCSTAYDAAILDIMLPGLDGLSVLSRMRAAGQDFPVLILSARDQIDDRIAGLDAGADDYMTKPFSLDELLARLRALTRRTSGQTTDVLSLCDLELDSKAHLVRRGGAQIELTSREFSILEFMLRNQGIVLSRQRIEDYICNYDYEGSSNMIDVYIRYLRKKIDENFETKLIHTVRYVGYVLRGPQ